MERERDAGGPGWRLAAGAALAVCAAGVVAAAVLIPRGALKNVVPESNWADAVSPWLLGATTGVFGVCCARAASGRAAHFALWLGVLCTLAALRELDLHVLVNPPNIHLLGLEAGHGVRFRLDWWTDPGTSALVRIAWALIGLAVGTAVVAPGVAARYPWVARVRQRDAVALLLVGGAALMAVGYGIDDLLARTLRDPSTAAAVEEVVELAGQSLVSAAAAVMLVRGGGRVRV